MTDAVSGVNQTKVAPAKTEKPAEMQEAAKTEVATTTSPIAPATPPESAGSVANATPTDSQAKKLDMYA